jgi:uncharacterized protein DUF4352
MYAALFSAAVSSAPTTAPRATTACAVPAPNVPAEQNDFAAPAGIGTEVPDGAFGFTVTDVETGMQAVGESFLHTEAQGSYVLVHVTVRNTGNEPATFIGANQKLLDAQGREFETDIGAVLNVPDSESLFTPSTPATASAARSYSTCRKTSPRRPSSCTSRCSPAERSSHSPAEPLARTSAAAAAAASCSRHGQCGRPCPAPSEHMAHRPSARGTCSRSSRCQTSGSPSARTRLITG